jgi:replicative DNA helicase
MPIASNFLAGRLPPHNDEAERCVLGSMLRDNAVIGDVLQIIRDEEAYYHDAHRKIHKLIAELYRDNIPIDLVTLGERLHQAKYVEDIGGYEYLARLWDETPSAAHAEHYAKIVRDKAALRALIHASNEILRDAHEENDQADELLAEAERKIMKIAEASIVGQYVELDKAIHEAYDRLDARSHRESISGISTGYIDLDELTGGFQNSELIIVAARPSVGKTAVTLNFVRNIALEANAPAFYVSLEQSRVELAERLLSCEARVESSKFRKGHPTAEDMQRIVAAGGTLRNAKVFIDDSPGQNMLRIAANARRLRARHGIRAVFVDYLQLVEPDNRKDPRQEQVAQISRRLKFLAKELKIPVIACAQLNRGVELRAEGEPKLADLRESGAIEQDADTVMLLHRPKDNAGDDIEGVLEIIIAKQRNGPTGRLRLTHLKHFMRFENYAGPRYWE